MIYLELVGHDYDYEIKDIVRLFFKDVLVEVVEDEPSAGYGGIFIHSSILRDDKYYSLRTVLKVNGVQKCFDEVLTDKDDEDSLNTLKLRRKLKREVKRQIYNCLVEVSGKEQPWGILTGIRPVKIVHELMNKRVSKDKILKRLNEYYRIDIKKSKILYEVAETEREILNNTDSNMISIYIGIPFCPTRCVYCSFTSNSIEKYGEYIRDYLNSLYKELKGVRKIINERGFRIENIYIGGGTPTSIDSRYLKKLLLIIEQMLDLQFIKEYTLEAGRPDTITGDKLEIIKDSKISRICINPQSMNSETLKLIGRAHSPEDVVKAFRQARKTGFDNINMDIIAGLPGENIEMFKKTLYDIETLDPESLTVHTMSIKRASVLKEYIDKYDLDSSERIAEMVEQAQQHARLMGMHPYYLYRQKKILGNQENTGYCKPGFEGIYNIQMMEEKQTVIALGAGAATKVVYPHENRIERAFNVKNIVEYINRTDEMIRRKERLLNSELTLNI